MALVQAQEAFGIFASFDGNCPDTENIFVVGDEVVAKNVCAWLNANKDESEHLAYIDGFNSFRRFEKRPVLVPVGHKLDTYETIVDELAPY